ncbi:two-component system sensor histidine kinase YesM [Paenibacillus phyllosphaerae]|uniref:Two-component system sensor histidine kinase YesM n=1 Tax=Paenibacillus phyllosphaerae TaxID=274593 RepID=A0A7W5FKL5_9BACL|nr:histidine kinase [Paenibacillus phyllosphaerae]MBB3108042.1 two-component system sensor histidine kinase YesM [Paenibacillus phyllosphaerae]
MLRFPVNSIRNTIFIRLVLTYLVVILPIIILGVYLYNWSYKNASQEISRATLTQLNYYLEDLDRELEWLEIQQFDLLQDNDLNKLAITWEMMDSIERTSGMNYLMHRLTSIKNSSPYIKDVVIHLRTLRKTVSAAKDVTAFDEASFGHLQGFLTKKEGRLLAWNDTLHLSAAKNSGKSGKEPLYIVQIELDPEKLKESLRQLNMYPASGSFLAVEYAGFTLASDRQANGLMQQYLHAAARSADATQLLDLEGGTYHFNKAYSDQLGVSVVTFLPEKTVSRPLSKFEIWAWLFAIMSFVAIIIYSYSTYRFVHKPLLLLVQSFRRMEGGTLDIPIEHEQKDEFGFLYHRFNHMLKKLQALIDQDFKQKLMMQKAELKQLQSQINPHFLYNSFFILNSLARTGDTERIELFTNMLGEYFRFITRNGEDHVPLSEEVKHSRMYTDIQTLRFSRRIKVRFDELPVPMEKIRVPRLIIQPIIENAYEHSLEKMDGEGLLRVTFELEEAEARIIVENNGTDIGDDQILALSKRLGSTSESYEMTGMMNIHRRIALIYGDESGLLIDRSELGGLKVVIRMKLEGGDGIA